MTTKKTSLEIIKNTIEARIESENHGIRIMELLIEAFKPFIGKPVTKNLANAAQKSLGPDYEVSWEYTVGLKYITVKDLKSPKQGQYYIDNGYRFFMGWDSTETYQEGDSKIQYSGFRYHSTSWGDAAKERNEKCKKILKSPVKLKKLADAFDALREAQKILDSKDFQSYEFPARSDIEQALGLSKGR